MRRISLLVLPLLLAAFFLGACGGDEGDNGDNGGATATASAGGDTATSTPATSEGSSGGDNGDNRGNSGADGALDLEALAQAFETATFTATYRVQGTADGEEMDGEWRWYQDGSGDRLRMDFEAMGDFGTMISTPDGLFICAEGMCFGMPADSGAPNMGGVLTEQVEGVQADAMAGEVRAVGTRDIAGTRAECYEFEEPEGGASGLACYAEGGIPVLIESTGDDADFRMEAIEFTNSVSDEDFEPPFPVTGLPTGN